MGIILSRGKTIEVKGDNFWSEVLESASGSYLRGRASSS